MTNSRHLSFVGILAAWLAAASGVCGAQRLQGDAALSYQWVHSNTQPGDCGCFGLNGGGASATVRPLPHLAAAVEVSGVYEGDGSPTGNTLTLVSYLAGPRFYLWGPRGTHGRHLQPFGEVLLGAAHAGGGLAGAGDGRYAFATRAGGGLDLPLAQHFSLRLVQADYFLTDFPNTSDDHQNNFLISAGAVFRWSR